MCQKKVRKVLLNREIQVIVNVPDDVSDFRGWWQLMTVVSDSELN